MRGATHLNQYVQVTVVFVTEHLQQRPAAGGGGAAAGERQTRRPADRLAARQAPPRRLRPGRGAGPVSAAGQEAA
jgi:hypothetical protein